MSHFTRVKTKIKNKSALLAALADMGYTANKVELHDTPQNLYGYRGDQREQTAEIILRRRYVGGSSNDIGFKLQEDGTYEAIISEYDSGRHNENWRDKLSQRYAYHNIKEELSSQGFSIESESEEKGELLLVCSNVGF